MGSLPAPSNPFVQIFNVVVQALVLNLGANAAIAVADASAPWLKLPIISQIFSYMVNTLAQSLATIIEQNGDVMIVMIENQVKVDDYNQAIEPYKQIILNPEACSADKQAALIQAKAAIDNLVHST